MFLGQSKFLIEQQYSTNEIKVSLSGKRKTWDPRYQGAGFKEINLSLLWVEAPTPAGQRGMQLTVSVSQHPC